MAAAVGPGESGVAAADKGAELSSDACTDAKGLPERPLGNCSNGTVLAVDLSAFSAHGLMIGVSLMPCPA